MNRLHGIPGDPVVFQVRSFNVDGHGKESWDFGDGSPTVSVASQAKGAHNPNGYALTQHRFASSGHYLVSVSRTNRHGDTATTHLHVVVD